MYHWLLLLSVLLWISGSGFSYVEILKLKLKILWFGKLSVILAVRSSSWASLRLCVTTAENYTSCATLNLQFRALFYIQWLSWASLRLCVTKAERFSSCASFKLNIVLTMWHSNWSFFWLYVKQAERS